MGIENPQRPDNEAKTYRRKEDKKDRSIENDEW